MQDELSRLEAPQAVEYGQSKGYTFLDVSDIDRTYFSCRLEEFASILPSDNDERMRSIMQFVGKRIVRDVPMELRNRAPMIL